jgi:hypothetical protein
MRDVKKRNDGSQQIKVTYPKFKGGEATVRDVREKQNFGMKFMRSFRIDEYNVRE